MESSLLLWYVFGVVGKGLYTLQAKHAIIIVHMNLYNFIRIFFFNRKIMCMPRFTNQDKAKSLGFFLQCNPETESLYVSFILVELMVQYCSKLWAHLDVLKPRLCRMWLLQIACGETKTATAAKMKKPKAAVNETRQCLNKSTIVTKYYCMSIVKHYLTFHPLQAL